MNRRVFKYPGLFIRNGIPWTGDGGAGANKSFFLQQKRRFAHAAFADWAGFLLPMLRPFLKFTGKLQLLTGYEPALALYKHKIGNGVAILYIFCNEKGRKW
jgi:hypothetical protein